MHWVLKVCVRLYFFLTAINLQQQIRRFNVGSVICYIIILMLEVMPS